METYGKLNPIKKLYLEVKTALFGNSISKEYYNNTYIPKLKKRFWIAVFISAVLISPLIPAGFLGTPFVMKWGLR